jgi:hypothetical protein
MEVWKGKRMQDVQQHQSENPGQWVQAQGGLLVGYHMRR